jgi:hypothetical protein
MGENQFVDTGFELNTLVREEYNEKEVYMHQTLHTNQNRNLTILNTDWAKISRVKEFHKNGTTKLGDEISNKRQLGAGFSSDEKNRIMNRLEKKFNGEGILTRTYSYRDLMVL